MSSERRLLLFCLVGLFAVVAGVVIWGFVYDARTHFLAGTTPSLEITPPTPELPPVRSTDPSRGSSAANAVPIVEFADFSCLYCRLMETELSSVLQNAPAPVRVIWRDLPLVSEHPEGLVAAMAARCAGEQQKFWEMHDALFVSNKLDVTTLKTIAQKLKLDGTAFDQCLSSGKYQNALQSDVTLARDHGILGAPTLFVGNELINGYASADDIRAAVRRQTK